MFGLGLNDKIRKSKKKNDVISKEILEIENQKRKTNEEIKATTAIKSHAENLIKNAKEKKEARQALKIAKKDLLVSNKKLKDFDIKYTLTSFAGLRASSSIHDFIVEESAVKGFINVAGIESPGVTSSPAIATFVSELLQKTGFELNQNLFFILANYLAILF